MKLWTLLILCLCACSAEAATFYASPSGSSANSGIMSSPWDLDTALSHASIQPGDTVCLRGGTYRHPNRAVGSKGYAVKLQGALGQPIVVKPYNSERVIIDGGMQSFDSAPGNHYRIQGLEVVVGENLTQSRVSQYAGSEPPADLLRPWGGLDFRGGTGVELVHNYVHDNLQGIGHWGNCSGLVYGNVIVRNGWNGPDRKHGAGIYAQNATGKLKSFRNNLVVDNYAENVQLYGSMAAYVDHCDFSDNSIVRGSVSDNGRCLIGGERQITNVTVERNWANWNVDVGYTGLQPPGWCLVLRDNRIKGDFAVKSGYQFLVKPQGSNIWQQQGFAKPRTEGTHGDNSGVDTNWSNTYVRVLRSEYDPCLYHVSVLDPDASESTHVVPLPFDGDYRVTDPYGSPASYGYGQSVSIPSDGVLTVRVVRRI